MYICCYQTVEGFCWVVVVSRRSSLVSQNTLDKRQCPPSPFLPRNDMPFWRIRKREEESDALLSRYITCMTCKVKKPLFLLDPSPFCCFPPPSARASQSHPPHEICSFARRRVPTVAPVLPPYEPATASQPSVLLLPCGEGGGCVKTQP